MMFRTHLAVSLLAALIALPRLGLDSTAYLIIFLLGSFMPDIDVSTSFVGRRMKIFGMLFKHRGIFHSLWMLALLSGMIWLFWRDAGVAFGLGYLTHLCIDMLSRGGIRLFHPFRLIHVKGFARTNGVFENLLFVISILLSLVILII